jgi:hypothetical protein
MICFERLFDTNFSNLHEMKYQKIIVKKQFALGIVAAASGKGFFNLVGDIAESPTSTKVVEARNYFCRGNVQKIRFYLTH